MTTRCALVVGGADGIGRAVVEQLAGEGAAVCVADIDHEGAADPAQSLAGQGAQVDSAAVDVRSDASVAVAVSLAVARMGNPCRHSRSSRGLVLMAAVGASQ